MQNTNDEITQLDSLLIRAPTLKKIKDSKDDVDGWKYYKTIVAELSTKHSLLEVGAGRSPLFSSAELNDYEIDYFANDISESELERAGSEFRKECFDVCGEIPENNLNKYDVICANMVQEHVPDGGRFYRNLLRMLKPSGISISFHPVLFAPPFVVNKIWPERLSAIILSSVVDANRQDEGVPKFPAIYSHCYAMKFQEKRLKEIGASDARVFPMYGHNYYRNIPFARSMSRKITKILNSYNMAAFATYSYTIVVK
ncbi:methyltransferase [Salinisphaera aquimarina]|uniref:Methyltransferase n=1 Tax=Salinisphaera aquimarina TaxID=2094031 RepID=A0ABV7EP20_9GAMM